jgi:predicted MFS family arabinose efflux permease
MSPPVATATAEGAAPLSRRQTAFMVAALVASVISFQLNATMLAPAIRDINTELGPGAYAQMSTYFYLSGAIANVVFIRWSDYIGRKRVLIGIMVVLCIGTLLCVVSTSLGVVVVGRILQGGCNVTFGLAFLILRERLSGQAFGLCCGVIASVNGGVAGVDALLGGVMVDLWGYRSIFVLILVVGVAAIAFGLKAVPADDPGRAAAGRMDWVGAALIASTVAGINLFLAQGGRSGWVSPVALGFVTAAIVALVALIVVEKRITHPLVDIDQMRSRYAWPVIVVIVLCLASFTMTIAYIIPSIAEEDDIGFGTSAEMTALLFLTPAAVAQLISAPLVGRLAMRIGFVTVLRAGLIAAVPITALLAIFAFERNVVILLVPLLGLAFGGVPGTAIAVLGVMQSPKDEPGSLPGLSNAAFGVGSSLGFAWAGPIVGQGTVSGFHSALWVSVAIGIVALGMSLILKPRPTEELAPLATAVPPGPPAPTPTRL